MFHLGMLEGPASFRLCCHGLGWRGATRRHPAMRIPTNGVGTYLLVLTIFALYAQIGM